MSTSRTSSARSLAPFALTAALGLLFSNPAFAQNIVQDGTFEADAANRYVAANYPFPFVTGPSTFGPWTVTNGIVDVDGFSVYAHSGNNSVDLTPGLFTSNLTQTLTTAPGQDYLLSFFTAAHSANTFAVKIDGTVIPGSPSSIPNTIATGSSDFTGDYIQYLLPFQATSSSSVLEFDAQDPDTPGFGPNTVRLDDVSVMPAATNAVPEPSSLALLGLGLGGLALFTHKRRRA